MVRRNIIHYLRLFGFATVLAFSFVDTDGQQLHQISAAVLGASILGYFVEGIRRPRLGLLWQIGYLAVVAKEGYFDAEVIRASVDPIAYDVASRYVTGANASLLIAYLLVVPTRGVDQLDEESPVDVVRNALPPALLIVLLFVVTVIVIGPLAMAVAASGRLSTGVAGSEHVASSAEQAVLGGLGTSAGIILPSLIMHYALWVSRRSSAFGFALASPVFLLQFMTGTRFPLLMSSLGATAVSIAATPPNKRGPWVRLVVSGIALLMVSSVMSVFRTSGVKDLSTEGMSEYFSESGVIHSEGTVLVLAKIVDYFRIHEHLHGSSSATILTFWIPRALWPAKPLFIDYWFIRAYQGESGFGAGHSTGSTFAADAYADFGFHAGILFCVVPGLLIGWLERVAAKAMNKPSRAAIVIIAPTFGAAAFAVRSLSTAIIEMSGCLVIGALYALAIRGSRPVLRGSGQMVVRPQPERTSTTVGHSLRRRGVSSS